MAWQTVTLVFTDLVGSTELSARVGAERSELLRKEHFALLRTACADAGGREVKNLGDGVMLAFESVRAAVGAAVEVQRRVTSRNRRADHELLIRIGIAVGEVNAEDGDFFGEPVVQAARLCARADGGQILATDLVRNLAGAVAQVEFTHVGLLDLKGLPVPVLAHEVQWLPTPGGGLSLPTRFRVARESPHVGRGAETAVLASSWHSATSGEGRLVLVAGEPGIGKTRLVSDHAIGVHAHGGTVLYGSVSEGLRVPYQPWVESLGHVVEDIGGGFLEAYVAAAGPDLVRLLPRLGARMPGLPAPTRSDGETERYLLMEAVTRFLSALAERNPLLVVLDDLHWADKPTLLLLSHLHRSLADSAVQVVATYRDSEPADDLTECLAQLRREDRVDRVAPAGLRQNDISELLHNASGQQLTPESLQLCQLLERDTAGNPLFVTEALRDLREAGHIAPDSDGVWGLTTPLQELPSPASVRELVAHRVGRLGPDAVRVLTVAATIGLEFEIEFVAEVADLPVDRVVELMDEGLRAALLAETATKLGHLRFVHALIAHALHADLSSARRARLHRHVADVLLPEHAPGLGDLAGKVANHLIEAEVDDDSHRRRHPTSRSSRVDSSGARRGAALVPYCPGDGAADRGGQCRHRVRPRAEIGTAMRDAGDPEAHDQLIRAAQLAADLGDGARLAEALFAMDRSFATSLGETDDVLRGLLEKGIELCPDSGAERAHLLAMLGSEIATVAPLELRRSLVDEALQLANDLDPLPRARVLVSSVSALLAAETLDRRRAIMTELRELVATLSDPFVRTFTAYHSAYTAIEALDRPGVTSAMEQLELAGSGSQPLLVWSRAVMETCVLRLDGHLGEAEAAADEAFAFATGAGITDAFVLYAVQLMDVRIAQGRIGELLEVLVEASDSNPTLEGPLRTVIALAQYERGLVDDAHRSVDRILADGMHAIARTYAWLPALDQLAMVANRLDRRDAAEAARPLVAAVPDVVAVSGPTATAHSATILGVLDATLGHVESAETNFELAAHRLAEYGAPVLLARNYYEHARALVRSGSPAALARVAPLAEAAAQIYREHDCPALVQKCDELLLKTHRSASGRTAPA